MRSYFERDLAFKQSGFSLIEVLIAMAILAISLLAAATMQLGSIRNNATGNMGHPGEHAGQSADGSA